jgi:GDP-L-fucose synthase
MERRARIYVAGHRGLAGSAIVRTLQAAGYRNLLLRTSQELDLTEQPSTRALFQAERPEYVIDAAAKAGGIVANHSLPAEFIRINLAIQTNLIHESWRAGVKRLLFLGSNCVYPRDCPQPMREDDVLTGAFEPTNEGYAIAKIAGIKLCEYSNRQYGTNFISLMPCNVYGYGDHFEPERSHVVSALIYKFDQAKRRRLPAVEVWGTGTSRRELLFVDDLVDAMVHFMRNVDARQVGSFVNIGLGRDISIRDLAHLIKDIVGFPGEIVFAAGKPDGMPRKLMNVERAAQLGWTARVGIPEGLRLTYDWYLKNVAVEMGVE